jgi:hypothetical protein
MARGVPPFMTTRWFPTGQVELTHNLIKPKARFRYDQSIPRYARSSRLAIGRLARIIGAPTLETGHERCNCW